MDGQPTVLEYGSISTPMGTPEAIPFVTVSGDSGELEISTEAMTLLDGMQTRKIAVIAFCGS